MNRAVAVKALVHLLLTHRDSTMLSRQPQTVAYRMCGGQTWTPRAHWSDEQYATCFRCLRLDPLKILLSLSEISANHDSYGWAFGSI
jgi:hypothetical protein